MTYICVSKLTNIGSDNGLSTSRRQAIIWFGVRILLIWPLETKFSEISIKIHIFSCKKMNAFEHVVFKIFAILFRPQCVNWIHTRQFFHYSALLHCHRCACAKYITQEYISEVKWYKDYNKLGTVCLILGVYSSGTISCWMLQSFHVRNGCPELRWHIHDPR